MFNTITNLCEKVTAITKGCETYININSSNICKEVSDVSCYYN